MRAVFVVLLLALVSVSQAPKPTPAPQSISLIRYCNSMPQFGATTITAFVPSTTLFTSVPASFLTTYTNITAKSWVFTAAYATNVTALSLPYTLASSKFYSLYTYQTAVHQVFNKLIADNSPLTTVKNYSDFASPTFLRTVNLLQYDFPINVFNLSNNAPLFQNVTYGQATNYTEVLVGDYITYWTSSSPSKRGLRGGSNQSGDPFMFSGHFYTYWVLPSGSFIVEDGSAASRKRNLPIVANVSSFRLRRKENSLAKRAKKVEAVNQKSELSNRDDNIVNQKENDKRFPQAENVQRE